LLFHGASQLEAVAVIEGGLPDHQLAAASCMSPMAAPPVMSSDGHRPWKNVDRSNWRIAVTLNR
jgi:hypothetical protein